MPPSRSKPSKSAGAAASVEAGGGCWTEGVMGAATAAGGRKTLV